MQPTSVENSNQAERKQIEILLSVISIAAAEGARMIQMNVDDRASLDVRAKSASDFVTALDIETEKWITTFLLSEWPGEAHIMGEELTPGPPPTPGVTFVVDPIDGTTNFLHGYPEYAVSIAAVLDSCDV